MILIIDNYDSFVFNLSRYLYELGYNNIVKRNNKITVEEIVSVIKPSHIILSPGPCWPKKAGICLEVVSNLYKKIPILGVCLGHQVIGEKFGGKTIKSNNPSHGKKYKILHDSRGILKNIPSPIIVGRYHSLIVSKNKFPKSLIINSTNEFGDIMALQHKNFPTFGIQFHPESILTEFGYQIIYNFIHSS